MLLGHFRLEIGVDHLIGMGGDRHAAWETRGSRSDLVQREWRGVRCEHGRNAFRKAALHLSSRYYMKPLAGMSNACR